MTELSSADVFAGLAASTAAVSLLDKVGAVAILRLILAVASVLLPAHRCLLCACLRRLPGPWTVANPPALASPRCPYPDDPIGLLSAPTPRTLRRSRSNPARCANRAMVENHTPAWIRSQYAAQEARPHQLERHTLPVRRDGWCLDERTLHPPAHVHQHAPQCCSIDQAGIIGRAVRADACILRRVLVLDAQEKEDEDGRHQHRLDVFFSVVYHSTPQPPRLHLSGLHSAWERDCVRHLTGHESGRERRQ
ncbi:hypothetical protein V8E36_002339 [Tilletia maclaganii]